MPVLSKARVCSLALSHLGNKKVNNIDTPTTSLERICSLHYDVSRKAALRDMIANFSLKREYLHQSANTPAFGYGYAYDLPKDCIKVLGIGEDWTGKFASYSVENGQILYDEDLDGGLPCRFVSDVEDVSKFDVSFVDYFALRLASDMCMDVTNDLNKWQAIDLMRKKKLDELLANNGQENRPVKVSRSKYKDSRYAGNYPTTRIKN